MVALIALHEGGHALVMKHYGIPIGPVVFIPFFGASVQMDRMPRNAWENSMIALGMHLVVTETLFSSLLSLFVSPTHSKFFIH
jgi:Zn-dependent protease